MAQADGRGIKSIAKPDVSLYFCWEKFILESRTVGTTVLSRPAPSSRMGDAGVGCLEAGLGLSHPA